MRNDSHNIIIPHAHPCKPQVASTKLSPRNLASLPLSPARSSSLRFPLREAGVDVRPDLPQNRPLGLYGRPDAPRAQFRPRTKLSLHYIRPEPSLRGTTLRGHLWHNNCLTRNTVQSRQRVPGRLCTTKINTRASIKF